MDDRNYAPPEDIFAPDNADGTIWGYPLDLADLHAAGMTTFPGSGRTVPGRHHGETREQYVARVAPQWTGTDAAQLAQWYDSASEYPA